jgi:hypothetical protein
MPNFDNLRHNLYYLSELERLLDGGGCDDMIKTYYDVDRSEIKRALGEAYNFISYYLETNKDTGTKLTPEAVDKIERYSQVMVPGDWLRYLIEYELDYCV